MRMPHAHTALLVLCLAAVTAHGAELTPEEARGKQIYTSGTSPSPAGITAQVGVDGFALPASAMPCASCHGADARGRPEGGVIPSNITWAHLTQSYGHQHSYGRTHPAFNDDSIARAISAGVDPAGNRLDVTMPRYSMSFEDLNALLAYLKKIAIDFDAGVTPDTLRLATLLPLSGAQASLGQAMSAVLQAYVADLNSAGGINGRVIELQVIAFGAEPAVAIGNLQQALQAQPAFALLAPYSVGIENELAALAEQQQLPIIGPYTLQPPTSAALDRYTFYLFSGIEQQLRVLVDQAAERFAGAAPAIVLAGPDVDSVHALSDAVAAQCKVRDWQPPGTIYYAPGGLDPALLAARLQQQATDVLFFLGTSSELGDVLQSLDAAGAVPTIYIPANLVSPSLLDAPAAFSGQIVSAYPRSPADVNASGLKVYQGLQENNELSTEHAAAQLATLAAAATLAEGLKLAGKNLSRDGLIAALEGLNDYETGFTPPLTFGLNRRIGALGAYVVRLDLEHRTFAAEGPWRALN